MSKQEEIKFGIDGIAMPEENEIIKQKDFGSFKVIITNNRAIYTTNIGYAVSVMRFTTNLEGVAADTNLYSWLYDLIEQHEKLGDKLEEKHEDYDYTNKDLLWSLRAITESNMITPLIAFADLQSALERTNEFLDRVNKMSSELLSSIMEPLPAEDVKKNVEEFNRAKDDENMVNVLCDVIKDDML